MRLALPALALTMIAGPAAAQHCWPTEIVLVVQDARGAVIDPRPLMDSLQYSPRRGHRDTVADFAVRGVLIDSLDTNRWGRGETPVISWHGRGDCRVDMREVVLRRGGVAMRLWMDLHLDSEREPGASTYRLRTPPFASGTWRLDVCELPEGESRRYVVIPPRWVRVSTSGAPGTGWQPPRGCGGKG